jgi:hypothetical protein
MNQNIGKTDRIIRLSGGVILLILSIWLKSGFMALAGLFTIYEGVVGWCAFYQLIGKNTCPLPSERQRLPILKTFITGIVILIGAIMLNIGAAYVGYYTWYDLLGNFGDVVSKASIDNLIFLFIGYPFILGLLGMRSK